MSLFKERLQRLEAQGSAGRVSIAEKKERDKLEYEDQQKSLEGNFFVEVDGLYIAAQDLLSLLREAKQILNSRGAELIIVKPEAILESASRTKSKAKKNHETPETLPKLAEYKEEDGIVLRRARIWSPGVYAGEDWRPPEISARLAWDWHRRSPGWEGGPEQAWSDGALCVTVSSQNGRPVAHIEGRYVGGEKTKRIEFLIPIKNNPGLEDKIFGLILELEEERLSGEITK